MIQIHSILSNSKEQFRSKIYFAVKHYLYFQDVHLLQPKIFSVNTQLFSFQNSSLLKLFRTGIYSALVIQDDSSLQNLSVSASFHLCQLILSMDALVGSFSSVTTESVFIGWSNPKIKTPYQLWNQWILKMETNVSSHFPILHRLILSSQKSIWEQFKPTVLMGMLCSSS